MPQNQNEIPLELNTETRIAIATGNNASWLCSCTRDLPLLGKSGQVKGSSENTKIVCPNCCAEYFVVPDGGDYKRAKKVVLI